MYNFKFLKCKSLKDSFIALFECEKTGIKMKITVEHGKRTKIIYIKDSKIISL